MTVDPTCRAVLLTIIPGTGDKRPIEHHDAVKPTLCLFQRHQSRASESGGYSSSNGANSTAACRAMPLTWASGAPSRSSKVWGEKCRCHEDTAVGSVTRLDGYRGVSNDRDKERERLIDSARAPAATLGNRGVFSRLSSRGRGAARRAGYETEG